MKAYLDHSATTPVDKEVAKAMLPYFTKKFGNASSLHSFGREAKDALEESREKIAKRLNAKSEEIIFTSGGSESDNLAIRGIAYANKERGKHIITTKIEHPAILESCRLLEKEGFRITYLNVDKEGFVDMGQLERELGKETTLVSVMHANNEIGTVQDIRAIGKLCKANGTYFHTDAVQSFTKEGIDVDKQGLDLVSISSHKIHGPKGIGALYVRKGTKLNPLIHGGRQEQGLRAGTENVAGVVGFAKAVGLATPAEAKKIAVLRDRLISKLLKVENSVLNGPSPSSGKRLCNNVNVGFRFVEGESMLIRLDMEGIACSTGSACSSQSLEPSHVLMAIGMNRPDAHGTLRFSLGRENTKEEIDYVAKVLPPIIEGLRKISPLGRK